MARTAPHAPSRPRVAVIMVGGLSGYLQQVVLGIAEHARIEGRWQIFGLFVHRPGPRRRVEADGAIVFQDHMGLIGRGVPCVYVGTRRPGTYRPASIHSDNHRIGQAAAEHLLERGLRTFSSVGDLERTVSAGERRAGFRRRVEQAGGRYLDGPSVSATRFDESRSAAALAEWLAGLPKPIGIMGTNDIVARQVADACRLAHHAVPEHVAIVGVDNEELMCMLSDPPLSSVDPDARRVGHRAAAMLSRMMDGEPPATEPVVLPPAGVVVRQSSDVLAIDDPDVKEAVRFIRDHCARPIGVKDVLRVVPAARRSLDRRFQRKLGRTVHDEIQHARIQRACDLLTRTGLSIGQVAANCGFGGREYFTTAFTKWIGTPPATYRKQFQAREGAAG